MTVLGALTITGFAIGIVILITVVEFYYGEGDK